MKEEEHPCDICGGDHEELWSFGEFGDNEFKKRDGHWYCERHFRDKEYTYNKRHEAAIKRERNAGS